MQANTPTSSLTLSDLPEDLRPEGERLKARYHALASDAGLLTEDGAMDLGKLEDFDTVKKVDFATLRALFETAEALAALGGLSHQALQQVLVRDGLDAKLKRSIENTVAASKKAYAAGAYGFSFNERKIRFDPARIPVIKEGLEAGSVNGVFVTAYPTLSQVAKIALRLKKDPEELLSMPVTEFLIEHFAARGGIVHEKVERTKAWKKLRWAHAGSPSISQRFEDAAAQFGFDPRKDFLDVDGRRTDRYDQTHAKVYGDLPVQQTVRDVAGTATITFTNVEKDGSRISKQLGTVDDPSFISLLLQNIDALNPVEFLAFAGSNCNPKRFNTYPDLNTVELLSGITKEGVARGDSGTVGIVMEVDFPQKRSGNFRARPVIRS